MIMNKGMQSILGKNRSFSFSVNLHREKNVVAFRKLRQKRTVFFLSVTMSMSLDTDFDYPRCVFCEVHYGSPECQQCPEYDSLLDEDEMEDC